MPGVWKEGGRCSFLNCCEAFDTISYSILLEKLPASGMSGYMLKNWLNNRMQRVLVNEAICGWWWVTSGVPQDQF